MLQSFSTRISFSSNFTVLLYPIQPWTKSPTSVLSMLKAQIVLLMVRRVIAGIRNTTHAVKLVQWLIATTPADDSAAEQRELLAQSIKRLRTIIRLRKTIRPRCASCRHKRACYRAGNQRVKSSTPSVLRLYLKLSKFLVAYSPLPEFSIPRRKKLTVDPYIAQDIQSLLSPTSTSGSYTYQDLPSRSKATQFPDESEPAQTTLTSFDKQRFLGTLMASSFPRLCPITGCKKSYKTYGGMTKHLDVVHPLADTSIQSAMTLKNEAKELEASTSTADVNGDNKLLIFDNNRNFRKIFGSNTVNQNITVNVLNYRWRNAVQEFTGRTYDQLLQDEQASVSLPVFLNMMNALQSAEYMVAGLQIPAPTLTAESEGANDSLSDSLSNESIDEANPHQHPGAASNHPPSYDEVVGHPFPQFQPPQVNFGQPANLLDSVLGRDPVALPPAPQLLVHQHPTATATNLPAPNLTPVAVQPPQLTATPASAVATVSEADINRHDKTVQNLVRAMTKFSSGTPSEFAIWFNNFEVKCTLGNLHGKWRTRLFFLLLDGHALTSMSGHSDTKARALNLTSWMDLEWDAVRELANHYLGGHNTSLTEMIGNQKSYFQKRGQSVEEYYNTKRALVLAVEPHISKKELEETLFGGLRKEIKEQFVYCRAIDSELYDKMLLAEQMAAARAPSAAATPRTQNSKRSSTAPRSNQNQNQQRAPATNTPTNPPVSTPQPEASVMAVSSETPAHNNQNKPRSNFRSRGKNNNNQQQQNATTEVKSVGNFHQSAANPASTVTEANPQTESKN